MVHQPVSRGLAVFADAWLLGWLVEISADLWETVAHQRCFTTLRYTNPRTLLYFLLHNGLYDVQVKTTVYTYVNTSTPHPAMAIKILGERSRAGFMAQPVFILSVMLIAAMSRPTKNGRRLSDGAAFFLSTNAITNTINIVVQ